MPSKAQFQTLLSVVLGCLTLLPAGAFAQTSNAVSRITQEVNESQRTVLVGNTHPLARAQYDKGVVSSTLPLNRMSLILKPSPAQEAALQRLLAEQQDPKSPSYHKWLTPVQFGQLFGPSDQDIQKVTSWLTRHGFIVDQVANGRQFIQFSGTAGEVEEAFQAPLHNLVLSNGEHHIANMNDPSIPTALVPVVAGVRSLHDFFPKPQYRAKAVASRPKSNASGVKPKFTFPAGEGGCNVLSSAECYALGPTDLANVYSIPNMFTTNALNGSGVTVDIMADSNIHTSDVTQFQGQFGFVGNIPNVIIPPGSTDPGPLPGPDGDEIEAILDVEWVGSVAPQATINLIVSKSSSTTFGGDLDAEYVIDTAPTKPAIMSESFGECELGLGTSGNQFYDSLWQQGATEGITIIISAGDNGASGCDVEQVNNTVPTQPAQFGLAVNGVGSTDFNVAVGGTDFNDFNNFCNFWNPCSGGANNNGFASAEFYIPETTWNDSCTNSVFISDFNSEFGSDAQTVCNNTTIQANGLVVPVGGSGGQSNCTTSNGSDVSSCSGGNPQPAFQTGVVPAGDTTRDMPDISMFAGDGEISASFYIVCEQDFTGDDDADCNLEDGPFIEVGGTSVSTQVFAGVMALVVEQNGGASQGNPDSVLYSLAKAEFAANCNTNSPQPHSTCVFNDVTSGTIAMPCVTGSPDCTTNASFVPAAPRAKWMTPTTMVTLVGALCVGLLLFCFPGRSRAWSAAIAVLALAAFAVNVGCGGGNSTPVTTTTPPIGVLSGYNAGPGYDLATGLGSINVENLVAAHGFAAVPGVQTPPAAPIAPAPSAFRRIDLREWQPAIRAMAITLFFCLGIIWLGLRQRPRCTATA